jgi:hypothetical protein
MDSGLVAARRPGMTERAQAPVIARSPCDEAIQAAAAEIFWIASLTLAMTLWREMRVKLPRHAPRRRGIQYAAAVVRNMTAGDYWIIRLRG